MYQQGSGNLKNEMLSHHPHFEYRSSEPVERKCVNALTIWLTIKKQITEDHKTQHVKYLMQKCFFGESVFKLFISLTVGDAKTKEFELQTIDNC